MQKVRFLIGEAKRKIDTADHLIYVTYPAVNEVKMLYTVTENIANAVNKVMKAVVRYDRLYKMVPVVEGDYRQEFAIFRDKSSVRHGIDKRFVMLINELNRIVEVKKNSPMVFVRGDKLVICGENYTKMVTLNLAKVKEYVQLAKGFVERASRKVKC